MKITSKTSRAFCFLFALSAGTITAQNNNEAFFNNLDFNRSELKSVEQSVASHKPQQALKQLLTIYREKENFYLQVDENDVAYIKNNYPKDVATTIEVADQVLNKYFF